MSPLHRPCKPPPRWQDPGARCTICRAEAVAQGDGSPVTMRHADDEGLIGLRGEIAKWEIRSIAIPPLGCGLGGLEWSQVRELIVARLDLPDVDVVLYPPGDYRESESSCTIPLMS